MGGDDVLIKSATLSCLGKYSAQGLKLGSE